MDQILDQILDQIWRFFEHEGISLNTNILDTGLINLFGLIIILIIQLPSVVGETLRTRKAAIETDIQDAETRLSEAKDRLAEISKQYDQLSFIFNKIKEKNNLNLIAVLEPDSSQFKKDLAERFERALETSKSKERQIFLEIKQKIIYQLLNCIVINLHNYYKTDNDIYTRSRSNDFNYVNNGFELLNNSGPIRIGNFLSTENVPAIYARALFDFQKNKHWSIGIHITDDLTDLQGLVAKSPELIEYLNNPLLSQKVKHEVLTKILKNQIVPETFDFLMLLVNRNRINILPEIISNYVSLIDDAASLKKVEITTVRTFTPRQEKMLISILKKIIKVEKFELTYNYDPSLIAGFIIKVESTRIDCSIKGELQQYASHFDTVLEI